MTPLDLAALAVLAFVGVRIAQNAKVALRPHVRRHVVLLVRGLRWRHFLPVPFIAAAVIATASLLLQLPYMDVGWWSALGGQGNPVFGATEQTAGTPLELLIPLLFLVLLLPALPLLAEREEVWFRRGAEHWSTAKRVWRGVQFGLVHALVGVPVGVALALSVGGWWFTVVYLRAWRRDGPEAALLESTRAHLAYNLTLVTLVLVAIGAAALGA